MNLPGNELDTHNHTLEFIGYMLVCVILILYLTIGSYMELKMFKWGHETGVIILIGVVISVIYHTLHLGGDTMLKWNNDLFFDFLLPLIIFTTGYNIRRRKFFSNIANISKFGLLGTVLTFIFLALFTWLLFLSGPLTKCKILNSEGNIEPICSDWSLDVYSIFYFCAILTGSDIIAFVTLVKFEDYPSLFSIVLGEGLYNDVVVIILYETMKEVAENTEDANHGLGAKTPLVVMGTFLYISVLSLAIGLFFGVLCTLMTKHFRFISQSAVFESTLLISCAMCGYMLSEMLHLSAICSLVVTSVIYSHYTWYNLSPQGKHVTALTFQTLGYMAEALVFAFIGMTSVGSFLNLYISWQFIVALLFFVVAARTLGIFISYYTFACCKGSEANKLTNREIMFAVWAAYIRGAIAFGLTMNLDEKTFGNENNSSESDNSTEVARTTMLALVIITTFLFGGFTPMVKSCLMGKETTIEDMNMTVAQKRRQSIIDQNSMYLGDPSKLNLGISVNRNSENPHKGSFLQYVVD